MVIETPLQTPDIPTVAHPYFKIAHSNVSYPPYLNGREEEENGNGHSDDSEYEKDHAVFIHFPEDKSFQKCIFWFLIIFIFKVIREKSSRICPLLWAENIWIL